MKIKQIMYRSYCDLEPQEKRFYTLNSEKYELNTCEECPPYFEGLMYFRFVVEEEHEDDD